MSTLTSKQMTKLSRLKELGSGVRVDRVLGRRVLVKTIVPRTEIDAVEERGLLVVPDSIKAEYVPMPITGIVLGVGDELLANKRWWLISSVTAAFLIGCLEYKVGWLLTGKLMLQLGILVVLIWLLARVTGWWTKVKLKEGDMIMFSRVSGLEFTINSQDLRIIHVNDILSMLVDTDESVVEVKDVPERT